MSILKVARLGHPVLRQKASDVEVADIKAGKFRALIDDMIETMHEYEGVGLAGPQVHLPLRIFVFEVQEKVAKRRGIAKRRAPASSSTRRTSRSAPRRSPIGKAASASPSSAAKRRATNGCASAASITKATRRSSKSTDFTARIFQHEIDHTDGHVYLDRMPDLTTLGYTVVL